MELLLFWGQKGYNRCSVKIQSSNGKLSQYKDKEAERALMSFRLKPCRINFISLNSSNLVKELISLLIKNSQR
jgi:hypothetical protein